jgi:hypothetical protein
MNAMSTSNYLAIPSDHREKSRELLSGKMTDSASNLSHPSRLFCRPQTRAKLAPPTHSTRFLLVPVPYVIIAISPRIGLDHWDIESAFVVLSSADSRTARQS